MELIEKSLLYETCLSFWLGYKVNLMEEFTSICPGDFDFIELLIFLENKLSLNLLETDKVPENFDNVKEFFEWVETRPQLEKPLYSFKVKMSSTLLKVDGEYLKQLSSI